MGVELARFILIRSPRQRGRAADGGTVSPSAFRGLEDDDKLIWSPDCTGRTCLLFEMIAFQLGALGLRVKFRSALRREQLFVLAQASLDLSHIRDD